MLKPFVTSEPDITEHSLGEEDSFLVVATDGIWDVLTNEEVAKVVLKKYRVKPQNGNQEPIAGTTVNLAHVICCRAKRYGSKDNLSVIVADLRT